MLIFINDCYLMVISDAGSTGVRCFIRRSLLYISLVLSLTPPRHQGIHQFSSLSCLHIFFANICSIIIKIILNLINDSNLTIQNSQAASHLQTKRNGSYLRDEELVFPPCNSSPDILQVLHATPRPLHVASLKGHVYLATEKSPW